MTVADMLKQAGETESQVLKEHLILLALSKISRYETECALFEAKYAEPFDAFQRRMLAMKNQEDFAADDDLLDWEFADRALRGWNEKLDALRHVD
ncbi:hypothetical protein [Thiorhodovibrio winogradskyi]|uniref:hypothetical protein n=2 Tax=Thiorhodovibrio TaxID=61593 RepID=UPI001913C184|nr:hypothetical protein [Thiorhodovibrio winogradskyi]MBK5970283.1 hypothetical protein [Thiorhodovibrio winogradskyi]